MEICIFFNAFFFFFKYWYLVKVSVATFSSEEPALVLEAARAAQSQLSWDQFISHRQPEEEVQKRMSEKKGEANV